MIDTVQDVIDKLETIDRSELSRSQKYNIAQALYHLKKIPNDSCKVYLSSNDCLETKFIDGAKLKRITFNDDEIIFIEATRRDFN